MFKNCTRQPTVPCKFPGSPSAEAGRFISVPAVRYETAHIFPHKVLQRFPSQLVCQLHTWGASAALDCSQRPETCVLMRLPKLKSTCIALWMWMHTARQEGISGSVHPLCKAVLSRAALGTKLTPGFSPVPWLLQPAA